MKWAVKKYKSLLQILNLHDCILSPGVYINLREVSGRFELEPGHYAIIPSTFKSNNPGKFMLRIFAQKKFAING